MDLLHVDANFHIIGNTARVAAVAAPTEIFLKSTICSIVTYYLNFIVSKGYCEALYNAKHSAAWVLLLDNYMNNTSNVNE